MPNTLTNDQIISATYVAMFNRAPDQAGLKFWQGVADQLGEAGSPELAINMAHEFAKHTIFDNIYGGLSSAAFVDKIYEQIGGKLPDADGRAFWLALLNDPTNPMPRSELVGKFIYTVLSTTDEEMDAYQAAGSITPAQRADADARKQSLENKATVALQYTATMGEGSNYPAGFDLNDLAALQSNPAYIASMAIIAGVTEDNATMAAPNAYLNGSPTLTGIITNFGDGSGGGTGGQTYMLTEGADTKVGTAGNDVFNANEATISGGALKATFTALDNLDGGAGIDTLNVTATQAALDTTTLGLTIKNIEIANFQGTKALTVDSTNWTGLTNLNVTKSVDAATLTAANTTDVKVTGGEALVSVTGGKSVTVAQAMDKAADQIVINKAGDVTVTATDSAAVAGGIQIGVGAGNAVTGAVNVTSTGAKIVNGAAPAAALDDIVINGGSTVSVTQAATADMGEIGRAHV